MTLIDETVSRSAEARGVGKAGNENAQREKVGRESLVVGFTFDFNLRSPAMG
ncbi:hypothetical protein AAG565_01410 [Fontimonas sp. SYSU GA230001]|uniref:hypothetical protein n=1 Tax=Fontimonas sp. SYSU GA230001 TaxID=3142450 RepID=UPI0032B3275A